MERGCQSQYLSLFLPAEINITKDYANDDDDEEKEEESAIKRTVTEFLILEERVLCSPLSSENAISSLIFRFSFTHHEKEIVDDEGEVSAEICGP